MEQRDIADTIYAAAFAAEFVRANAAGESYPHDKADALGRSARAAYYRVTEARGALLGAR